LLKRQKHFPRITTGIAIFLVIIVVFMLLLIINKYIARIAFGLTLLYFFYYMGLLALFIVLLWGKGASITDIQLGHTKLLSKKKAELCGLTDHGSKGALDRLEASITFLQSNDEILTMVGVQLTTAALYSFAGVAITVVTFIFGTVVSTYTSA